MAANVSGAAERSGGVKVSGVGLAASEQRSSALRYTASGEDGRAVETGQQPVERKADRRKKVKRRRRRTSVGDAGSTASGRILLAADGSST